MKAPIIFLFVLTGCAIFDHYKDNRDSWFYKSLTHAEKDSLLHYGKINKKWLSTNSNGDFTRGNLLVLKVQGKKYPIFILTGTWIERHHASGSNGWKALINDSTLYDSFGNVLYRELYMDENNDIYGNYLYAKWSSNISDNFIQTRTNFYPSGEIRITANYLIEDHRNILQQSMKTSKMISVSAFNEKGEEVPPSQVRVYRWYQPGIWMKDN